MEPLEYIDAFEKLFGVAAVIKSTYDRVQSNKETCKLLVPIIVSFCEPGNNYCFEESRSSEW